MHDEVISMHRADDPLSTLHGASPEAMTASMMTASLLVAADGHLSKKQVCAIRNVSPATLDRQIRRGEFPPGEPVSPGRVGWRVSVVQSAPLAVRTRKGGKIEPKARSGKLQRRTDGGRA
jgi:predicted DNA-binding transcriptional regulator AlpA